MFFDRHPVNILWVTEVDDYLEQEFAAENMYVIMLMDFITIRAYLPERQNQPARYKKPVICRQYGA